MNNQFSDLINEQGFLHEKAEKYFKERFCREVSSILRFGNSDNEFRIIGSVLKKIINDMICNKVNEIK